LAGRPDLDVTAFAVSWRRRHGIDGRLPAGVAAAQRAMPARPLHLLWRWVEGPPVEWFVGPADVVHGTNFVVPPTRRAARVVTVHDLTTVRFPELCDPATLAFPDLIRRALARGAWVHTPSAFVAAEVVERLGADPARVRPVHSGVPPLPAPDPDPRPLPPGTSRYVLAVGTAEPRKDLPGLVAAFSRLAGDRPELALVLAGPPGWGEAALDRAVAGSPAADRIVRTGWVDDRALSGLLGRAAVLAYPSLYEGFGFPPLQAMAAGVPVVATDAGAVAEVVGDGARLVPPGDPDALADGLAEVLDHPERAARLVAAGAARVAAFSWEATATGLAALYRDAAAGRSG
jgi:glycosyltransferase involved in cell wall biosynthesis